MNETKKSHKVVARECPGSAEWWVEPAVGPRGLAVMVPPCLDVDIEGLEWAARAKVVYENGRMVVDEVTVRRLPGQVLPQKAYREFGLDDIADAVRQVARLGKHVQGRSYDRVEGTISIETARELARGRTRSAQTAKFKRAQAIAEYRKAKREQEETGVGWPDIYAEVGRRITASRASVHRYLRDEIARGKR